MSTEQSTTPPPHADSDPRRSARTGGRRSAARAALALAATATTLALLPATMPEVADAGLRTPPVPKVPRGIEGWASYVGQDYCDPIARPGVVRFRDLVLRTYPNTGNYGIVRDCTLGGRSEHKEGRAWDWKVNANVRSQKAAADTLLAWLLAPDARGNPAAMARRIGIMYVIWNGRVWKAYEARAGWQAYGGISAHTDHVHFSFSWEGALRETSYFSGKVAPPRLRPPYAMPRQPSSSGASGSASRAFPGTLEYGARGDAVRAVQAKVGAPTSGWFGPTTVAAVKRFQAARGIPAVGHVGPATWAAMFGSGSSVRPVAATRSAFPGTLTYGARGEAVRAVQAKVGAPTSGWYGPVTVAAVTRYQAARGIPAVGHVGPATWAAMFGSGSSGGRSSGGSFPGTLEYGARGDAVRAVQAKVGAPTSGWYGPTTVAAVKRFQAARGIPAVGHVGPATWAAMFGSGSSVRPVAAARPVLRLDARGDAVVAVQRRLGVTASGWFGPRTQQAVIAFQRKHGLTADGVVGAGTYRALGL